MFCFLFSFLITLTSIHKITTEYIATEFCCFLSNIVLEKLKQKVDFFVDQDLANLKNIIDEKVIAKIYEYTQGIPDYVVKLIDLYKLEKDVELAFDKLVLLEQPYLYETLEGLSKKEKNVVFAIAEGKHKYSEIKKHLNLEVSTTLKNLLEKGIIFKTNTKEYYIRNPLLYYAIKRNL